MPGSRRKKALKRMRNKSSFPEKNLRMAERYQSRSSSATEYYPKSNKTAIPNQKMKLDGFECWRKYILCDENDNKLNEIKLLLKLTILLKTDERSTRKTEKQARESKIFPNKSKLILIIII